MSATEPLGKPELTAAGDLYKLDWKNGIEATIERFSEDHEELRAEVCIASTREPRAGLLHRARTNLMSSQARKTLAGELTRREPGVDWPGLLEQLCFLVVERYRAGEPAIDLRVFTPSTGTRWRLEPFVEVGGPTVLYADGGTGKSMFALAIAASISSGQAIVGRLHGEPCATMYIDFETDTNVTHERLRAICAGAGIRQLPPLYYRRQVASLAESAAELRREVHRLGVGFVVIDSLGMARGGEPESADVTLRLFAAARALGVPWLGVDHVTKQAGNTGSRPFGSVFTHNQARLTWGADKSDDQGDDCIVLALRNTKWNNGRRLGQLGYRIDFENDGDGRLQLARFARTDLTEVPGLAEKLPLRTRILAGLRTGPVLPGNLADAIDADEKAVAARVSEMVRKGELVRLEDKRVALAARTA